MKFKFSALLQITLVVPILCLTTLSGCYAASPKNNPVPGGVIVVPLFGEGQEKPKARFGAKDVLVTSHNSNWVAVIGLPQDMLPGKYILTYKSASEKSRKKSFRIEPLPASESQRTINLPAHLQSLEFTPVDNTTYDQLISNDLDKENLTEPIFDFIQIVKAGNYIPYGWLINKQGQNSVLVHSWITYITQVDEIVSAPSSGVVEQIFLSKTSGLNVILNHGIGLKSIVSYLNDTILKPGDIVEPGEVIGTTITIVDNEGLSIGRVDWQLMLNGYFIDPLQFSSTS